MQLHGLRLATVVAVGALVLAGCGGSTSDDQGSTAASPESITL